jgi:hypothetical protein
MNELAVRRPAGHVIIVGDGPKIERDTLQCCHCGGHWIVEPGSGRRRGFCLKCNAVHCGGPNCWVCRPHQRLIDTGSR